MSEMPVSEPGPPEEVVDKAVAAWRRSRAFGGWRRKIDGLLPAHRVFTMGLRALTERSDIGEIAEPVGWQFIVRRRGEPVAIEVSDHGLDVQIERGPQVRGASQIFGSGMEEMSPHPDAAVRMLRVPEMGLMAVWFQPPNRGDGVIVPLDPSPQRFRSFEEYDATDFLEQAADVARRRLEFYSAPDDGEEGGS
jgi:hypothetical protein